MIEIIYTDGTHPDFIHLCRQLDNNLNEIIGEKIQENYNQYNQLHDIQNVWIAYIDRLPVACAAFKQYESNIAEVKRVFVQPQHRGKGISKALMKAVEEKALESGYNKLILETGKHLKEAIGLYQQTGYVIIPNYGQYKDFPDSVCMMKHLTTYQI